MLMVIAEEQVELQEVGLNETVTPDAGLGPEKLTDSAEPDKRVDVMVEFALLPWVTEPEEGLADKLKSKDAGAMETSQDTSRLLAVVWPLPRESAQETYFV